MSKNDAIEEITDIAVEAIKTAMQRDLSTSKILDCFYAEDAVQHFGVDDLLEVIGEEACRRYFNIHDPE